MTAIVSTDIQFLLSAPGASAGFAVAGVVGNASGSGKYCSTTQLSATAMDNLFTDLTGAQNAASQVDYVCLFVLNNTASGNHMLNTVAWIPTGTDKNAATAHSLGVDPTAASPQAQSGTAQAVSTASATTAPAGVTFAAPSATNSGGVNLGDIPPGYVRAVWFKRAASNSAPLNNDGFTLELDFDTQG